MTEAQAASPLAVLGPPQFDELEGRSRRTRRRSIPRGSGGGPAAPQTIKDNQAEFLAMMNEPVQDAPAMVPVMI